MALSSDLLGTARQLAHLHERRPRQARRSLAWSRVYRNLDHNSAKKACLRAEQVDVSPDLLLFTTTFPDLQDLRHQADYDPHVHFQHNFVVTRINEASQALAAFQRDDRSEQLDFVTLALGMTRG